MSTITTKPLNDRNREVYADGEHIGWVTFQPLGATPGWTFTAADKRLTNRFPDGAVPMSTWQAALPGAEDAAILARAAFQGWLRANVPNGTNWRDASPPQHVIDAYTIGYRDGVEG